MKITIRERSWIAGLAARKLKFQRIAIVIGRTIHLHNVTIQNFVLNRRWVLHELKHVEQFQREGRYRFLYLYLAEYMRKGYYNNIYEIDARNSEDDNTLLEKYNLSKYLK